MVIYPQNIPGQRDEWAAEARRSADACGNIYTPSPRGLGTAKKGYRIKTSGRAWYTQNAHSAERDPLQLGQFRCYKTAVCEKKYYYGLTTYLR